jgi:hypothetical protein
MNKVILVKAFFLDDLETSEVISIPKGDPWGIPSKKESENKSAKIHVEKKINAEKLASDLELALAELYAAGFSLKEVVTVTSGAYGYKYKEDEVTSFARPFTGTEAVNGGASYGYGYGYSYTDSLIVIGVK